MGNLIDMFAGIMADYRTAQGVSQAEDTLEKKEKEDGEIRIDQESGGSSQQVPG